MSDRIFGTNQKETGICKSRMLLFDGGTSIKIALLAAFFATFTTCSAKAALFGSNRNSKNNANTVSTNSINRSNFINSLI